MSALLIAGPIALDDFPGFSNTLGGAGLIAAIAAAPVASTQLWARGGRDLDEHMQQILSKRRIDLAGVTFDGPTLRGRAATNALPTIQPNSADDVGGVLLIGLERVEQTRALHVARALFGGATRPVFIAPRAEDFRPADVAEADVAIVSLPLALTATGTNDALAAARALQHCGPDGSGPKAVLLTAGMLGGLLCYGQLSGTWPAAPVEITEPTGIGAAFAGVLAAWCAGARATDFGQLKRAAAVAGAVAGICGQGVGTRRLLAADRAEYLERFNKLRRATKS